MKFKPKKSLGQNFLIDLNIINIITEKKTLDKDSRILEIGPGTGNLTNFLLKKKPRSMKVIEKDENLSNKLKKKFKNSVEIINEDFLNMKFEKSDLKGVKIYGNLPYNVSSQILIKLIKLYSEGYKFKYLILMFQKEVADRILSKEGSKKYSRISVISQWLMNVERICDVKSKSFFPSPKVESTLVHFDALNEPKFPAELNKLEFVVSKAFNQRRKMLRGALKGHFKNVEEGLFAIGVSPTKRAENVTIKEFCAMAQILQRTKKL